jgi:hypothetical protein
MRELSDAHIAGLIRDDHYVADMAALRAKRAVVAAAPQQAPIRPDEAIAYVEGIAATWARATPEERAQLVQSTYERVTVRGPQVLRVKLTPTADQVGYRPFCPRNVPAEWAVARPTGVGHALTAIPMPIEGRDEWVAAVERLT